MYVWIEVQHVDGKIEVEVEHKITNARAIAKNAISNGAKKVILTKQKSREVEIYE